VTVPALRVVRRPKRAHRHLSLVAASQPIETPQRIFRTTVSGVVADDDWQTEAWDMYDAVGELRYYVGWRSSSCSRVRLIASEIDPDTGRPTGTCDNLAAAQVVNGIAGGHLGQTQLIKRVVECLTVPGEVWVGIIQPGDEPAQRWLALSKDEIFRNGAGAEIELPDGSRHTLSMPRDSLIRVWIPRARRASQPDSPVRACLGSLHEIHRTTKTIANASKSRLIGNGIVFVPQEMSLPPMNTPLAANQLGPPTPTMDGTSAVQQLQELLWQVAQTAYDDEDSMAALIPMFATVPGDQIKNVQHLQFENNITDVAIKTRNDAIARLAMGLDVSPERLLGLGRSSNHWCKDDQTEILTQRGWLRQDQLRIGDMALTLQQSGLSEWQPVLDIYRADVIDEPMLSMEAASHSSLSTAGHRWLVTHVSNGKWRWTTSGQGFAKADRIPAAARCVSLPSGPKYSDSFVRLAAAYMSDGSRLRYESGTEFVRIVKFDADEIIALRAVCREVFGRDVSERHHPTRTRAGLAFVLHADESQALFDITSEHKALKPEFILTLTEAQLHLFLDALIELGDGVALSHGARTFFQVEPSRLDAIEMAAILAGYRCTRGQRNQQTGFGTTPLHWLRAGTARKWFAPYVAEKSWQRYSGVVWCPTTENGTWFARRDGKVCVSGNSAWQLADEDVQLHICPVMELLCAAFNERIVGPVFQRMGIDPTRYMLWYDATGLTADPDKTNNATAAFDRGAITADALRSYLQLGDDTGYDLSTLEGWKVWARDHVSKDPTLLSVPQLVALLGPDVVKVTTPPAPPPEQPAVPAGQRPPALPSAKPKPAAPAQQEPQTEEEEAAPAAQVRDDVHMGIVDLMVSRALGLASRRRRGTGDRWDEALEDEVLGLLNIDGEDVRAAVRRSVRHKLAARNGEGS